MLSQEKELYTQRGCLKNAKRGGTRTPQGVWAASSWTTPSPAPTPMPDIDNDNENENVNANADNAENDFAARLRLCLQPRSRPCPRRDYDDAPLTSLSASPTARSGRVHGYRKKIV